MLLFPIPCMGSELLDLKLIKCETQHNKKKCWLPVSNGHSGAGV